jgi:PAS domain S-box-containing protein
MGVLRCKIHCTVPDNPPRPNAPEEKARQKKLRALDLLRPEPEPALDNLARLAAEIARVPMAAISLTDSVTQFYKAKHNWKPDTLPRGQSPCAMVTGLGTAIIVEDLKEDERFSAPVQMGAGDELRFYAGFPLRVDEIAVGALCVAHTLPHSLDVAQLALLELLAKQAGLHLKSCETIHSLESEKRELEIQELGAELAEEKYRSIFEHVQEGIFQTTAEGRFISANPMLAKIYGYDSPEELIASLDDISGQLYADPRRREEFVELMRDSGTIQNFVSQVRQQNGELIWITENVRAVRNRDGELLYYEGTVIDVTEQKETEQALRDSELLYHSLVESIPQNIVRKDINGRFTFANQKFCQTIGKPLEEILGKTDYDLSPKDLADKYLRDDLHVIKTLKPFATTEEHTTPEGGKMVIDVVKTPLLDSDGRILGTQCMFWDVTERHQMEEQLAYERDLLNAILDNVPDRIFIKDTESRFIKGSAALAKRLGLESVDEIVGKTDYDFHPTDQAKNFHEDEQRVILTGKSVVNKVEKQTDTSGHPIWASVTKVPFTNRSGMITGIIGISRDITALKLAEQESARARSSAGGGENEGSVSGRDEP